MISGGYVGTVTASPCNVFTVPAGPATVLVANAGTSGTIWIGPSSPHGTLSSVNGFPVPSGAVPPVALTNYPGSPAQAFQAVTTGTATLSWIISAASGGTGL